MADQSRKNEGQRMRVEPGVGLFFRGAEKTNILRRNEPQQELVEEDPHSSKKKA